MLEVGRTYMDTSTYDDATENVKLQMQLHIFCRVIIFAASREYVTVQGLKGLKCAIVCYFQSRIFNPTNLLNQVPPFVEWIMQM